MGLFTFFRRGHLMRWLRFNALRRGLFGGSAGWMTVLGLGLVVRALNSVRKKGPMELVFSEKLEPGAAYLITHLPPAESRRQKRRSRKRARAGGPAATAAE
jgi:hypothetical protein